MFIPATKKKQKVDLPPYLLPKCKNKVIFRTYSTRSFDFRKKIKKKVRKNKSSPAAQNFYLLPKFLGSRYLLPPATYLKMCQKWSEMKKNTCYLLGYLAVLQLLRVPSSSSTLLLYTPGVRKYVLIHLFYAFQMYAFHGRSNRTWRQSVWVTNKRAKRNPWWNHGQPTGNIYYQIDRIVHPEINVPINAFIFATY